MTIPGGILLALKLDPEAGEREIRLVAAVKLLELGRLSSGAAAQLAGLPEPVFMTKLADHGVPAFKLSDAEIGDDLAQVRESDRGERDRSGRSRPEVPSSWTIVEPQHPRSSSRASA